MRFPLFLFVFLVFGAMPTVVFAGEEDGNPKSGPLSTAVRGQPSSRPAAFALHREPRPRPVLSVIDPNGQSRPLPAGGGRWVLVNFWATWCAPCREELPALDRLKALVEKDGIDVLAINLEPTHRDGAQALFKELSIHNLEFYQAHFKDGFSALGLVGLPTTVLLGPGGEEVGRLVGPEAWDDPSVVSFLRSFSDKGE